MDLDPLSSFASRHARKLYVGVYAAAVIYFIASVASYYDSRFGFTSLAHFGYSKIETQNQALLRTSHYIHPNNSGFEGQFYAANALQPFGEAESVSNFHLRRILFSWTAFVLGTGNPDWILQAYCIQNFIFWLGSAWLLLYWFPPTHWQNLIRYLGTLFSLGMVSSLQFALLDGPSLFLILLAMRWLERGLPWLGTIALGIAGLGKETNLLAAASLAESGSETKSVSRIIITAVPLTVWIAWIVISLGSPSSHLPDRQYIDFPLLGFAKAILGNLKDAGETSFPASFYLKLALMIAIVIQGFYLLAIVKQDSLWRRLGIAYCVILALTGKDLWLDEQATIHRIGLPLLLCFNVLFTRDNRFFLVLVLANISSLIGVSQLDLPKIENQTRMSGDVGIVYDFDQRAYRDIKFEEGWYIEERSKKRYWRWSSGTGSITALNSTDENIAGSLNFILKTLNSRELIVSVNNNEVWRYLTESGYSEKLRVPITLLPGENVIKIASPQLASRISPDPRALSFALYDFDLEVRYESQTH